MKKENKFKHKIVKQTQKIGEIEMTYFRINPWKSFEQAQRRFNEFAGEIEKGAALEYGGFSPRADIVEDDKNYYLVLELPGMAKEDVKISVSEDRLLTVKGEKKPTDNRDAKSLLRTERMFGEFSRAFSVPDNLDLEHIAAKFENGVLQLVMPKIEPPQPKEIEISID